VLEVPTDALSSDAIAIDARPIDVDGLLRPEQDEPDPDPDDHEIWDRDDSLQWDLPDLIGTSEIHDDYLDSDLPGPEWSKRGRPHGRLIVDVLAWYCPFHLYLDDYGIYIRTEALDMLARRIAAFVPANERNWVARNRSHTARLLRKAAFIALYLHEYYHHKTESFATRLEIIENQARFLSYFRGVYLPAQQPVPTDNLIEEGLACAEVLKRLGKGSDVFGKTSTYGRIGHSPVLSALKKYITWEIEHEVLEGYGRARSLIKVPASKGKKRRIEPSVDQNLFDAQQFELMSAIQSGYLPGWQRHADWRYVPQSFRGLFDKRLIAYELVPRGQRGRLPTGAIPALQGSASKVLRVARQWGIRVSATRDGKGDHVWLENQRGDRDHIDRGATDFSAADWTAVLGLINAQYGLLLKNNEAGRRAFFAGPRGLPAAARAA
jgi:hypothetical protein